MIEVFLCGCVCGFIYNLFLYRIIDNKLDINIFKTLKTVSVQQKIKRLNKIIGV